jgi:hypothetical protein
MADMSDRGFNIASLIVLGLVVAAVLGVVLFGG